VRLEQLVLFGPSDNFSVQFGPRVTVLAGLAEPERASMLATLVDAMAGRIPNASVIYVDHAGRRVYADRTGGTFADDGVAAPSLSDLLGSDPEVITDLVTLRAGDLGLGAGRTDEAIEADLTAARASVEQLAAEADEATTYMVQVDAWNAELERLDQAIVAAPDETARWNWTCLRNQLDGLRAELASLEEPDDEPDDADTRLLAAVADLRAAGETWAEASTAATELGREVGPLPPVSDADLARVAATPETLPADFDERVDAVSAAAEATAAATAALATATAEPMDPEDGIVYQLAHLDQEALWTAHAAAVDAQTLYEAELADRLDETDPEVESEIEAAHHEVVRCQREVDRRFRAGILGPSLLAVGALLAGQSVSVLVGIPMLVAAAGLGVWLLALPRKALAAAEREEEIALGRADAGSWLGLHLRRIDDVMQPTDRSGLNRAVDRRSSTRLDWEEISGGASLKAAGEREEAIRAYADAIDSRARAAREATAVAALTAATDQEREARRALVAGLEGYGLADDGAADLDPAQIRAVLEQRTAAGRFARRAVELQRQRALATSAGAALDELLCRLGFDDGDLAGRLERAIVSVEAARSRRSASSPTRTRDELEAEIAALGDEVTRHRRLSWDLTPDPTDPPPDLAGLMDRRRALGEQISMARGPDRADAQRRLAVATERLRTLEAEQATRADGPTAVRRRIADRIARTTWVGPNEESLPLIIDDALVAVEPSELFKVLDLVVRLSTRTQIVVLTSDATIAKWARREAAHGVVTLFETDGAAVL
jgi:tetratricopeptide (TPR) repeat protein